MRDSLSVEERLALTLRFLATGRAFEDMKFSVTISPSAISQAVIETCEALMFSRITHNGIGPSTSAAFLHYR